SGFGEMLTEVGAGGVPVPLKLTACGVLKASSLTVTVPDSGFPVVVGAKATPTAHVAPTASGVPTAQSFPTLWITKLVEATIELKFSAAVPTSDTATLCAPLLWPTFTEPKDSAEVATFTLRTRSL